MLLGAWDNRIFSVCKVGETAGPHQMHANSLGKQRSGFADRSRDLKIWRAKEAAASKVSLSNI